jgi:hypothetical protein
VLNLLNAKAGRAERKEKRWKIHDEMSIICDESLMLRGRRGCVEFDEFDRKV